MDLPLNFKKWSKVLEKSYLQYIWTSESKKHTYVDRSKIGPKVVEGVLTSYRNCNPNTQRYRDNYYPETERVIIQQKVDNKLLRVVINPRTNPWTIITFIPGSARRYWNKNVF
ncbi:hypothetical protein RclHR1_09100005 [Rhizophagus clarus]|uniref:Uncharacterized protein n=1 Tax=Rhizophagus clarus TaxID=94130 RepID=A0A2Z6SHP6_9GLOM|nr:hypothetical protein RclHR1_09100005 [Rhizophagus clarus]